MEQKKIEGAIEALLFAMGGSVELPALAKPLDMTRKLLEKLYRI